MQHQVVICLLGDVTVQVDNGQPTRLTAKSRMGASVMEYLILRRGQPVSGDRLIREMWMERRGKNPENALKTMISRLRSLLHELCPGLGDCVAFSGGGYYWQQQPGIRVDALEILGWLDQLREGKATDAEKRTLLEAVTTAYTADLYHSGDIGSGSALVSALHKDYLDAVYELAELLRAQEDWPGIYALCARAMEIDGADERLHMEAMNAMMRMNRMGDAMQEYRRIVRQAREEGAQEGRLEDSVRSLSETGRNLRLNLETISRELQEQDQERQGPFFCDYAVFKEFYNIQMRNLERLGSTMFLGVITVSGSESEISAVIREGAMAGLLEVLRHNLRKGDIITRFSADTVAMLLPTVNYSTGGVVMERIERLFYQEYPSGGVTVQYRISPLGSEVSRK